MKRFLVLAALVLGLASCQTEPEGLDVNVGGEEQTVTINVAIPEAETRASSDGAFLNGVLEGDATMRYILQVYYNGNPSDERLVKYSDEKSVAFDVRLVPDRDYQFVVWADVVDGVDADDKHYNTSDLKNITLNGEWKAMDESRDAFTATEFIDDFNGAMSINMTLKRPFAKLRVVTTDVKALNNLKIVPKTATVTYITEHRVAFNAFTGVAANASVTRKTHSYKIADYSDSTDEQQVLFTDYFFAENDVVKFQFDVYEDEAKTKLIKSNTFNTDIYVKRNHLTTIKGNILTDGKNFNVEIEDEFDGESGKDNGETFANVDTTEELLDAINKGIENITLEGNIVLTQSLEIVDGANVVINLNGKSISNPNGYTIENSGHLTIGGNGDFNGLGGIRSHAGKVTINGGTFTGSSDWNNGTYQHILKAVNTEVVINGGTFDATIQHMTNAMINVSENSVVTINGGEFRNVVDGEVIPQFAPYMFTYEKNGKLIINDGDFYGGWRFNGETTTTDIYGGNFTVSYDGQSFHANSTHVLTIYGGVFSLKNGGKLNPTTHCAYGYKAVEENGVYVVRKPQELINFENAIANGEDVTLSEDLTLIDPVVVPEGKEVTINLNGKTLDIYTHKSVGGVLKNNGSLTIEGGVISSLADNGGSAIANNGTLTVKNATLNGAPNANGSWPSYSVNNTGIMTVENTTITSYHGAVASYGDGAVVTLNNCTIDMAGIPGFTSHGIYTYNNGKVVVNGGTYENKATDQSASGASVINGAVEVNAGTFLGRIENYYGTPVIKGGTFSVKPNKNFIATGYKVIEKDGKFNVVPDSVDAVASTAQALEDAIAAGNDTILVKGEIDLATIVLSGYNGTIIGADNTAVINTRNFTPSADEAYQLRSNNLTFQKIGVKLPTSGNWLQSGFVGTGSITFEECNFEGQVTLNGSATWTFNDCTFVSTESGAYASFVYGATKATFNRCSFSGVDRAAKVYGTGGTLNVEYNTCEFTSSSLNKSGVEIDASYATTTVGLNNCTQTAMAGLFALEGSKGTVLIDSYTWIAEGLVKKNNEYLVSSKNGLNYFANKTATDGTVIKLTADIDFEGVEFKAIAAGYDKSLTFDGQNHTIKNMKIVTCSHNTVGSAGIFFCYPGGTLNVSNLIVDKATSEGATYAGVITGYTQGNASFTNVTVKDCNISGVKKIGGIAGFVEASTTNFMAENCKVINSTITATEKQAGTIIGYNAKPATLNNCTVENSTATAPAYCDGGVRCTDPAQAELLLSNLNTIK